MHEWRYISNYNITCQLFYYGIPAVSNCICSSSFFRFVSAVTGTSTDDDLPADGKGYQLLQFDGGAVLYHHGLSDGLRRHFREADSAGQLLCGVDAGRHGDG